MAAPLLLALAAVGLGVGFLSGLVGMGGGVLIVPFLHFFYGHSYWSGIPIAADLVTPVAAGTSLFVIMPTAMVGTWTYSRANLVAWRAAVPMAIGAVVASVAGASAALLLPPDVVRLTFGGFLTFTGAQLLKAGPGRAEQSGPAGRAALLSSGAVVGLLSALLGVGGGVIAIPLLINVIRLDVRRVAATSLAVVMAASLAGAATYAAAGLGEPGLPPGSAGYVHVTAALPILAGSVVAVRWGTRLNRMIGVEALRRVFGLMFITLGIRYIVLAVLALN